MDYSNVPYSRKILLAFLVVSVTFMELLDTTIINTAIPPISKALNVDVLSLKAAVTVYLISLAIFIPISGWIAETFGTKRTIISAVLLFTVSSFLCGNSKTIEELIIFRIIQGVGAALMTPVSRLILIHIFRRDELLKVSSIVGIPIIFGPIVGPLLGGFITTNFEWYWIFYINVPIGIIVVILMSVFLKTLKQHEKVKFDFPGFVLFGLGLASVSFVFENEGNPVFKKHTLIILLITGLLILTIAVIYAVRKKNAVLDFSLFKYYTFRFGIIMIFLGYLSIGGLALIVNVLLQMVFGLNPFQSGLVTFTAAVSAVIIKPLIVKITAILGYKNLLKIYPFFIAIPIFLLSFINIGTSPFFVSALLFVFGFGMSVHINMINLLPYTQIPEIKVSHATSFVCTMLQFSMSLGISIGVFILDKNLLMYNIARLTTSSDKTDALASFSTTFIVLGILSVCLLFFNSFFKLRELSFVSEEIME